jgi:hypothetical protein
MIALVLVRRLVSMTKELLRQVGGVSLEILRRQAGTSVDPDRTPGS